MSVYHHFLWNVHVLAEPSRERHMPSAPEISDSRRDIRIVEVLAKHETELSTRPIAMSEYPHKVKVNCKVYAAIPNPVQYH